MRKLMFTIVLFFITMMQYGQIIADHRAVANFDDIPEEYITEVKKMMVWFAGESHSKAYRKGMSLLEAADAKYNSSISWGFLEKTNENVRVIGGPDYSYGEDVWFTWKAYSEGTEPVESELLKGYIKSNADDGNPISVMGFAWCWDMIEGGMSSEVDPEYNVHWYGSSDGGPDGNTSWGLNAADQSLTGNSVSMDTYLAAIADYNAFCMANGYTSKVVYTTGPVDIFIDEKGYQRFLKNEYIRDHVKMNSSSILFDYADILCHDDDASQATTTWDGHTYPTITNTNVMPDETGHISYAGALRLAKAQWWMLARIAGWEGSSSSPDTEQPSVPTGLSLISASDDSITISWNSASDNIAVTGYHIFRDGGSLGTETNLSYTDYTVEACSTYNYSVSAFDAAGNESAQSTGIQVNNCETNLDQEIEVNPSIVSVDTGFLIRFNGMRAELVQVIGINGSIVKEIIPDSSSENLKVDMVNAVSGPYILKIRTEKGNNVTRLMLFL